MIKIIGIIIVAAVIIKLEVPALLKNKDKKGLVIFSFLLTIGLGFGIALALNKTIPDPIDFLTFVLKPLNNVLTTH